VTAGAGLAVVILWSAVALLGADAKNFRLRCPGSGTAKRLSSVEGFDAIARYRMTAAAPDLGAAVDSDASWSCRQRSSERVWFAVASLSFRRGAWELRYRDRAGRQRTERFHGGTVKTAPEPALDRKAEVERDLRRDSHVPREARQARFAEYFDKWWAAR
jgi:hypothetical protein